MLVDRFQALSIVQALRAQGLPILDLAVTPASNQSAFEALSEAIAERRITWVRNERLEAELANLSIDETPAGGFKVVDSDKRLHRDIAWSLGVAVGQALKAGKKFNREGGWSLSSERGSRYERDGGFLFREMEEENKELMAEKEYHTLIRRLMTEEKTNCPSR